MITLNPPYLSVKGLTLFGDHADPLQWYYWPDQPRLSVGGDGTPSFQLTKYRKDLATLPPEAEAGGGFLNFTVGLFVGQDALASAQAAIRQQFNLTQAPRLAPILARGGTVRLIFLDTAPPAAGGGAVPPGPPSATAAAPSSTGTGVATATAPPLTGQRHVERASYPATPSLVGVESAAFMLNLNIAGTTIMQNMITAGVGSLTGAGSLTGVVYDIVCDAMRPPLNVAVSAAWDQVSAVLARQFGTGGGAQSLWTIDEIDNAVTALIADRTIGLTPTGGAIPIMPATPTTGGGVVPDDHTSDVKRFVREAFFIPSLVPPDLKTTARPPASPVYTFKGVSGDALKALEATVNMPVVEAHFTALARLSDLIAPYRRESLIREVDLSEPFFKIVKVNVEVGSDLAAEHVAAVEVALKYKDQDVLLFLTDADRSGHAQWMLDPTLGSTYSYTCKVLFQPDAPAGTSQEVVSDVMQSNDAILVIAPGEFYTVQTTLIQAAGIPFDRYAKVDVELGYGDRPETFALRGVVTLTQSQQSGSWAIRLGKTQKPGYQYRLTYYPTSGAPIVGQWIAGTGQIIIVDDLRG